VAKNTDANPDNSRGGQVQPTAAGPERPRSPSGTVEATDPPDCTCGGEEFLSLLTINSEAGFRTIQNFINACPVHGRG
jgi:hypothetical protein